MAVMSKLVDEGDAEADEDRLRRGAALLAGDQHLGAGGAFGIASACRAA